MNFVLKLKNTNSFNSLGYYNGSNTYATQTANLYQTGWNLLAWNQASGQVFGWKNFGTVSTGSYSVNFAGSTKCAIGSNSPDTSNCYFPSYAIIHTIAWIDASYNQAQIESWMGYTYMTSKF